MMNHHSITSNENKNEELRRYFKQKLNHKEPQKPPNIYFIRRSPKHLRHYLKNPESLNDAMSKSPEEHKIGFKLFPLDHREHKIVTDLNNKRLQKKL